MNTLNLYKNISDEIKHYINLIDKLSESQEKPLGVLETLRDALLYVDEIVGSPLSFDPDQDIAMANLVLDIARGLEKQ